jgi:WS/DGAT/MGAT family acyltransferase
MVLKLHHAAVDGVAGAEIITALHDKTPESATGIESSDDTWSPERMPTDLELMARAGRNAVTRPLAFLRTVAPAVRHLPSTLRGGGMGGAVTATRFNRDVSPHRVFGEVHFELAALKKIKTALDGPSTPPAVSGSPGLKINDVGLALVGGGLRRYLEDNDELPNESLIALMPISVRPTQTQRPQGLEVDAAAGGNRFAMMPIPMATDVDDPIERLRRIRQATAAAKNVSPTSARALVEMSELLPGALTGSVQRAVVRAANRAGRALGVHTIVTNVPGPQVPVYFCGARATRISGMAPIVDGMGLIHGIGSYDGDVPVCFTADREMMPDPEFYEDCLRDSYDELAAATTRFP